MRSNAVANCRITRSRLYRLNVSGNFEEIKIYPEFLDQCCVSCGYVLTPASWASALDPLLQGSKRGVIDAIKSQTKLSKEDSNLVYTLKYLNILSEIHFFTYKTKFKIMFNYFVVFINYLYFFNFFYLYIIVVEYMRKNQKANFFPV